MAKVIRFSVETIQDMDFEKLQVTFLAELFHIQLTFFNGSKKIRFSLIFCFASFDSFKDLTGCLEKLEILANRFGL